ncbi:MAG TPA: carboxypeptidase regulatory-like domain-containing protein, partial [Thermoanaerobaculia bacterium]|nr:carboxypeptidase regulatory-like domain-containing protein [Thermoanaerobaculia bacterium]
RKTTTADDQGAFSFDGVSPGFVELRAQAPRRQSGRIEGLEVKPGGALTGVDIVLAPGASIAGRVLGPDGQPIPGAQVSLAETTQSMMSFAFFGGPNGTDGEGRYRLDGVAPGPRTLEARAEGYLRAVRDVDVAGEMEGVDFTLQKGLEISGRVVDDAGAPIPGATVMLFTGRGSFNAQPLSSGADGSFRIGGVPDGTYSLAARKDGYSLSRDEALTVTVAGASVSGVELKLMTGGSITGRLSGLEFSQLSRVRVWANYEMNQGQVDADGVYRISGLAAGPWEVSAAIPGTSLHASGRVTLEPGASEAHLDLQFGHGHELAGVVVRNGQPLAGAGLGLTRKGTVERQTGATDHQGSFRFGGLENGDYELAVSTPNGAQHRESVEVSGDREMRVELRTASLAGRVVDALDSSPVSGVEVTLEPAEGEPATFTDSLTTDARGTFRLPEVGDGAWKLKLAREGYAPAVRELRVDGSPLDDLEIRLSPTEGIAIEAVLPSGRPPDRIQAAVLDASGKALSSGSYPVGEAGRARLASVPPGSWQVLVDSDQSAPVTVAVTVPGPAVRVTLPPAGTVRVQVPALTNDPAKAKVTLTGPGGTYRALGWNGTVDSEFDLYAGLTRMRVPAGVWQVVARAVDGRSWSATATVTPGGVIEVILK